MSKLFEWYATRPISLKEVAQKARDAGLIYRKSGAKVPVSTVHTILRNRLYTGQFEWNGKLIQGKHEPLVSVELWERVQGVLDGRFAKKAKRGKHDFAFSGLIACAKCGCSVVGEIKKQRYVYYHCTGYADKCQGNPASCRRKLCARGGAGAASSPNCSAGSSSTTKCWNGCGMRCTPATPTSGASTRKRSSGSRPNTSGSATASTPCIVDKLDGRVDSAFFDKMSAQWREEQNRCLREIERHQTADKSYMDEGVQLLELARNAQRLFEKQEPREKRRLAQFRAIELHLGGRRSGRHLPPTV